MALTSLAALTSLLLAPLAGQIENVVLATADKPANTLVKRLSEIPLSQAINLLKKDGHVEVVRGGRTYLIGPELIQEGLYRTLPAFYASVSRRGNGAFSVAEDPPMLRFVQAAFGDRYGPFDKSKFVLGGASQIELQADGKTIKLKRESTLSPDERRQIEEAPLLRRDPTQQPEDLPRLDEFAPVQCDRVHLTLIGKPEYRQFAWGKDLQEVSRVIDERLQELHKAASAALHGLFQRLPSDDVLSDIGRLEKGASFSSLPAPLRTTLERDILTNPSGYGFADEDEAERFLARAQVGGVKKGFKLTGAKRKASLISIALYP